jgi:hypothetical protein
MTWLLLTVSIAAGAVHVAAYPRDSLRLCQQQAREYTSAGLPSACVKQPQSRFQSLK